MATVIRCRKQNNEQKHDLMGCRSSRHNGPVSVTNGMYPVLVNSTVRPLVFSFIRLAYLKSVQPAPGLLSGAVLGGAISIAGRIFSSSANLIVSLLLVRIASIEDIGRFFLVQSVLFFSISLITLGVPQYLLQKVARDAAEKLDLDHRFIGNSLHSVWLTSGLLALMFAIGDASFDWSRSVLDTKIAPWMVVAALAIFSTINVLTELDRGLNRIGRVVFIGGVLPPAIFVMLLQFAQVTNTHWSAQMLVVLFVGAAIVPAAIQIALRKTALFTPFNIRAIFSLWVISLPFWGTQILLDLIIQSQTWIIARWGGVTDVGLYAPIYRLTLVLSMMNVVFSSFMPPLISRLHYSGDNARVEIILRMYATASSSVVLLCCLAVAIFGEHIVYLILGPDFVQGCDILLVICLMQLVNQLCGNRGVIFLMLGHEKLLFKITLMISAFGLIGGPIVMSKWGLLAYVCFLAFLSSFQSITEAYVARRIIGLRSYFDHRLLLPRNWRLVNA